MPCGPTSRASAEAKPRVAYFALLNANAPALPRTADVAPVNRIFPPPFRSIPGTTCFEQRKPPSVQTRHAPSNASGVRSAKLPHAAFAAWFTRISGSPSSSRIRAKLSATCSGSAISVGIGMAFRPDSANLVERFLMYGNERDRRATSHPSATNLRARAAPKPGPTPAITAICSIVIPSGT